MKIRILVAFIFVYFFLTQTVYAGIVPTLSVTNSPVDYNASAQSATVTGSVPGVVSNVRYDASATVPTNAGTYAITADFVPTDNVTYNSLVGASAGNFVINKINATIIVNGYTGVYDGVAHGASGSATGLNSENLNSILRLGPSFTNVPGGTPTWTFPYPVDTVTNYNSATGSVSIIISKANQTITFNSLADKVYGDADFTVSATVTSNLNRSFTASGGCSVSADVNTATVSILNAGTCIITAHQTGNGNYNAASDVPQTFTINPKPITVTAQPNSKPYDGLTTASAVPVVTGGLVGSDTANFIEVYSSSSPGSGLTLVPSGTAGGNSGNNYSYTFVNDNSGVISRTNNSGGILGARASSVNIVVAPNISTNVTSTNNSNSKITYNIATLHFSHLLSNGSRGNEVAELQKFLNSRGYNSGVADGRFGPKTKNALIKFQIANKLKGDGVVGPIVRAILNR